MSEESKVKDSNSSLPKTSKLMFSCHNKQPKLKEKDQLHKSNLDFIPVVDPTIFAKSDIKSFLGVPELTKTL